MSTNPVSDAAMYKIRFQTPFAYVSAGASANTISIAWNTLKGSATSYGWGTYYSAPNLTTYWANIYSNYIIAASKINVQMNNLSSAADVMMNIWPNTLANSSVTHLENDAAPYLVQPHSKWKYLAASGGQNRAFLKHYMTAAKLIGRNKLVPNVDDSYAGAITTSGVTSPSDLLWWNISVASPYALAGGSGASISISGYIEITFYVRVFGRTNVPA